MRTITLFLLLCLLTACEKKPEASNLSDLTLPVKTASVTEGIYYPSSQMIAQAKPLKSVNLVVRVSGIETALLTSAIGFLSDETGLKVDVYSADAEDLYDPQKKSRAASPGRPAILLE